MLIVLVRFRSASYDEGSDNGPNVGAIETALRSSFCNIQTYTFNQIYVVAGIGEAVGGRAVEDFYKQVGFLTHSSYRIFSNHVAEWKCADQSVLGYNGLPDDVASLVSYLASKEAHFITGESLLTFLSSHRLTRTEF